MSGSRLPWNYHNRNAKNLEIATGLSRIVMHVLRDTPPSVPLEVSRWCLFLRLGSVNLSGNVHDIRGYRGDILRSYIEGTVGLSVSGMDMLMRVMVKNPLRRRASRSALVRSSALNGGGVGRMFVSHAAVSTFILKNKSRQFASQRVGFVLTLPMTLRLGLSHTRLIGLRAANSCLPAVVLSVASVSLPFLVFVWFTCPVSVARLAWRVGGCFCFVFGSLFSSPSVSRLPLTSVFGVALVFSSSSRPLSSWAGRLSLPLRPCLLCVCVCLAPRVSRPIVFLTCYDHVQLSLPVDLCVRE